MVYAKILQHLASDTGDGDADGNGDEQVSYSHPLYDLYAFFCNCQIGLDASVVSYSDKFKMIAQVSVLTVAALLKLTTAS